MARKRERRFWSEAEKRRIVAQTRAPGVSVSRVARRYDVNANLVFRWLRDPRFSAGEEDAARFLPVEVVPDAIVPAIDPGGSDGRIEIVAPSGHRVSIHGAFDPDVVSRLVRGLG